MQDKYDGSIHSKSMLHVIVTSFSRIVLLYCTLSLLYFYTLFIQLYSAIQPQVCNKLGVRGIPVSSKKKFVVFQQKRASLAYIGAKDFDTVALVA